MQSLHGFSPTRRSPFVPVVRGMPPMGPHASHEGYSRAFHNVSWSQPSTFDQEMPRMPVSDTLAVGQFPLGSNVPCSGPLSGRAPLLLMTLFTSRPVHAVSR